MSRIFLLTLSLVLLLLTLPVSQRAISVRAVSGKASAQGEAATIEAYARGLDRYIKRNSGRGRYFADISAYKENAPEKWQEFRTKRLLDKAWQDGKTYKSANVWFNQSGHPVVALFTLSSPSGDWAQYVTTYYRDDGSLAKINDELRTFMGDVIRIRERLYDANGKVVKEQTRYLDLTTQKPKKVEKDSFADMETPVYAKTGNLPFYNLLKGR